MFDRTIINPTRTEYVPYEKTVNINKSSTAQDARLLKEIEDEAINRLSNKVVEKLGDNLFEVVRFDVAEMPMYDTTRMRVIFKINGKMHTIMVEKEFYERDVFAYVEKELCRQIFQALMGEKIVHHFLGVR